MLVGDGGGGGEETGIDPSALQSMIGTMKSSTGTALALVNGYIGQFSRFGVDTSGLTKAAQDLTWAQDQLPMLSTRRALAQAVMDMNPGMTYTDIGAGPLDTSDAQTAAQLLAEAEASGNSKAARAAVQAIQQDIQIHIDQGSAGTAWLTAFYNAAGPQIAGLANTLHSEDGTGLTPLSKQDQQILNTYATGLAAVSKAGTLQQSTIDQLTADSTLWSATMLLKYGPSGSAYGTQTGFVNGQNGQNGKAAVIQQGLLAQMTDAVYQASQNGTLNIPLNWQDAQWADQQKQLLSEMQSQDPFTTMLQLDAQNKVAAGQVLAGPDGAAIAKALEQQPFMNYLQGQTQGYSGPGQYTVNGFGADKGGPFNHEFLINQQVIANFLNAATQDPTYPGQSPPRGTDALSYQAAQAAINILNNVPSPNNVDMAEPVRQALLTTLGRYMPDIASSMNFNSGNSSTWPQPVQGTFMLQLNGQGNGPLATLLQQIESNAHDAGVLQGEIASAFGNQYGLQAAGQGQSPGDSNLASDLAKLYGMTITQQQNLGYSAKQAQDAANAEINTIISMGEAGVGLIPGGKAVTAAKGLASVGFPAIPTLSTDNAAQQAASDLNNYATTEGMLNIPMVQGLINAGIVVPPSGASWYQNGQVVPNGQFVTWWDEHKGYYVRDLPTYNNPPGQPLPSNPDSSLTMEGWENIYGITNMNLIRQMQTAEGN